MNTYKITYRLAGTLRQVTLHADLSSDALGAYIMMFPGSRFVDIKKM